MIDERKLLNALIDKRGAVANESLMAQAADEFAYGKACGIYQGLMMAEKLITQALRDDKENDI